MLQEESRYVGMKVIGRCIDKLQKRAALMRCINSVFTHIHQNIILKSLFFPLKVSLLKDFSHHPEIHKAITYTMNISSILSIYMYIIGIQPDDNATDEFLDDTYSLEIEMKAVGVD